MSTDRTWLHTTLGLTLTGTTDLFFKKVEQKYLRICPQAPHLNRSFSFEECQDLPAIPLWGPWGQLGHWGVRGDPLPKFVVYKKRDKPRDNLERALFLDSSNIWMESIARRTFDEVLQFGRERGHLAAYRRRDEDELQDIWELVYDDTTAQEPVPHTHEVKTIKAPKTATFTSPNLEPNLEPKFDIDEYFHGPKGVLARRAQYDQKRRG